jgi:hypothetical protein
MFKRLPGVEVNADGRSREGKKFPNYLLTERSFEGDTKLGSKNSS